jgi:hypothetical protein
VSENGDPDIRPTGCEVCYPTDSSSTTSFLKITMDGLSDDDKTAIEDKTTAAKADQAIEEHIANAIRKLVSDLRTKYLHWKQPHPTTADVAEEVQAVRRTTPYSLRHKIRRTFKSRDSSKVSNDEEVTQHVIQNDGLEEGQAKDTAYSSPVDGFIHGELYIPRR